MPANLGGIELPVDRDFATLAFYQFLGKSYGIAFYRQINIYVGFIQQKVADGTADEVNSFPSAGSHFPGLLEEADQLIWQLLFYSIGKIGNLGHLFILFGE
jgi:hypothetical protein